jgi:hypothetical protein
MMAIPISRECDKPSEQCDDLARRGYEFIVVMGGLMQDKGRLA